MGPPGQKFPWKSKNLPWKQRERENSKRLEGGWKDLSMATRRTRGSGTEELVVPEPPPKKKLKASVAEHVPSADGPSETPPKISERARLAMSKGTPEAEVGPSGRSCTSESRGRISRKHKESFIALAETSFFVQFALKNEPGLQQVCDRRITAVNYSKLVLLLLSRNASIGAVSFFGDYIDDECFSTDTVSRLSERELALAQMYRKSAAMLSSFSQQLMSESRSFEEKLAVLRSTLAKAESIPPADLLLFVPVRDIWVLLLFRQSDCGVRHCC